VDDRYPISGRAAMAGPCSFEEAEALARRLVLHLAREMGRDEALRLLPSLLRALTGAEVDPLDSRMRQEVVQAARRLADLGLMAGTAGNLSVRESPTTVLITPAGLRKGEMRPDDLVRLDLQGNSLGSALRPSSEVQVHLAVYRARPDVHAVVHTHPPHATAFAAAGVPLDRPVLAEGVRLLGPNVPVVPFGAPSSRALVERLEPWLAGHDAFLLANHGALCLGGDLSQAVQRTETLEFLARVVLAARTLGGESLLSHRDLQAIETPQQESSRRG